MPCALEFALVVQQGLKLICGNRTTIVEALHFIATVYAQEVELLFSFNALCNGLKSQAFSQIDNCTHDGLIVHIVWNVADK